MKRAIKPVKDNMDKANTYRDLKSRYKRAVEEGFYLEAFLLSGAMIEDRELAFLYHCGVQKDRNSLEFSEAALQKLFPAVSTKSEKYAMQGIESKTKIIRLILTWVCDVEYTPEDEYLRVLKSACEGLDLETCLDEMTKILEWAKYRNEIFHSLYNKNISSLDSELGSKVKEGMQIAMFLDEQVKIIKKDNSVRKEAGLEKS